MTDVILERRGTIDKYMGDCIMAFWNAPLDDPRHATNACAAALAMRARLGLLNEELRLEAEREQRPFRPLAIGIGLNTGPACVGNMGSDQRFDYSVLGDTVNLASRLEGQSKTYGVTTVIGEPTLAEAPEFATLELDLIKVKGKTEAVRIHALLGEPEMTASPGFRSLAEVHEDMLAAYRAQDWETAQALVARCRTVDRDSASPPCTIFTTDASPSTPRCRPAPPGTASSRRRRNRLSVRGRPRSAVSVPGASDIPARCGFPCGPRRTPACQG